MNINFNDFSWHDANIKYIYIDRENPAYNDKVKFKIVWPDSNQSTLFEFYDCYLLQLNMNFGMIASESILSAEVIIDSTELDEIRQIWSEMDIKLDKLNCYKIITNTTNSCINIYANGFSIQEN